MNQKFRNRTKLTGFIELYDEKHSLKDLMPCHPEGLPIHSICQIYVYIFGGFTKCSARNQSKSGEKTSDVSKEVGRLREVYD